MISRNVSDTTRLVPQLRTVAREMALPLTEAGKISLRINQDTVKVNQSVTIHALNQLMKLLHTFFNKKICTMSNSSNNLESF